MAHRSTSGATLPVKEMVDSRYCTAGWDRPARLAAAALHLAGQRVVLGRWRLARRWRLASFRGGALSSRTVVELRLARRRRVVSSGQAERRRWANHRQTRQSAAGRAERRRRVSYVVQT